MTYNTVPSPSPPPPSSPILLPVGLKRIPPEIGNLQRTLSMLHVEGCPQVTHIPQEIGRCTKVALLYIKHNSLRELPTSLGLLANLASLSFTSNKLTSLPSELGQLANLASFWMSNNQVRGGMNLVNDGSYYGVVAFFGERVLTVLFHRPTR